jgi:hypothetical protein
MKKAIIVLLVLVIAFILIVFLPKRVENQKYCSSKDDCVPAECCHAKDCVNLANKPDCRGIVCTMECSPGTMDCGQGYCDCVRNECKAIIG